MVFIRYEAQKKGRESEIHVVSIDTQKFLRANTQRPTATNPLGENLRSYQDTVSHDPTVDGEKDALET